MKQRYLQDTLLKEKGKGKEIYRVIHPYCVIYLKNPTENLNWRKEKWKLVFNGDSFRWGR